MNCPDASSTTAVVGICTLPAGPNALIFPFSMMSVPFGIDADVTGTIVAPRSTIVCFLPGLFGIVDCARSGREQSAIASSLRIFLLLPAFVLLRFVCFFLQALVLLAFQRRALLQIFRAIEHDLAFDHRHVDARVDGHRMRGPDGEAGVLAHF